MKKDFQRFSNLAFLNKMLQNYERKVGMSWQFLLITING